MKELKRISGKRFRLARRRRDTSGTRCSCRGRLKRPRNDCPEDGPEWECSVKSVSGKSRPRNTTRRNSLSLDVGAHSVGRRRVDHQNYIHCASPSDAARQINIDLIEADEVALRPGKGDCGVHASYPGLHRRETTVELDSCAEQ